jgi:hypothetical protein
MRALTRSQSKKYADAADSPELAALILSQMEDDAPTFAKGSKTKESTMLHISRDRALEPLPTAYREVILFRSGEMQDEERTILLAVQKGLTEKQIAKIVGLTDEKTVGSRVKQAKYVFETLRLKNTLDLSEAEWAVLPLTDTDRANVRRLVRNSILEIQAELPPKQVARTMATNLLQTLEEIGEDKVMPALVVVARRLYEYNRLTRKNNREKGWGKLAFEASRNGEDLIFATLSTRSPETQARFAEIERFKNKLKWVRLLRESRQELDRLKAVLASGDIKLKWLMLLMERPEELGRLKTIPASDGIYDCEDATSGELGSTLQGENYVLAGEELMDVRTYHRLPNSTSVTVAY